MMDQGSSCWCFPKGNAQSMGAESFHGRHGLLIQKLDAPVVPMRIDGLWELKKANRHFAWPGEVSVIIGGPSLIRPNRIRSSCHGFGRTGPSAMIALSR